MSHLDKAKTAIEYASSYPVRDAKDLALIAIANALVAIAEGRGMCHAESDLSEWVCSECQCWIPLGLTPENVGRASEWRYCPHCRRKVVK